MSTKNIIISSIAMFIFGVGIVFMHPGASSANALTPAYTEDAIVENAIEDDHSRNKRNERSKLRNEREERLKRQRVRKGATSVQKLQQKVNLVVDKRLKELNRLKILLKKVKNLTAEQKKTLVAQLDNEINSLKQLKAKIAVTKDIATLRTHVKTLQKSKNVTSFYVAKMHIIIKSDRLLGIIARAENLTAIFDTLIKEAEVRGEDVTLAKGALAEFRKILISAKTKAIKAIATVLPLTVEKYPSNKTELKKARDLLRQAHLELKLKEYPKSIRTLLLSAAFLVPTTVPTGEPTSEPTALPTTEPTIDATPTP